MMPSKGLMLLLAMLGGGAGWGQTWQVPEEDRARENPIEACSELIEEGRALYMKQCLMCHGEGLEGDGPGVAMFREQPPDLSTSEARARLTDGEIFYKMTVGKPPMPAMASRLTEE